LDSEPTPAQAGESRARLREAVDAAHRIVRARLEDLSTRVPIGGLQDAVAAACDRARERGVPVEVRAVAAVEPAEPAATAVVLRVLGEALANAERHAGAASVLVTLDGADGALALTVEDDGCGLAGREAGGPGDGHFGIALMRERAASIGGRLTIGPGAVGGTRVRLEVPRP
jgi:two-component system, NarL family, nitrate/nitrite sensor histidine kinase NarX